MRGNLVEEPVNDLQAAVFGENRDVETDHQRFRRLAGRKLPAKARQVVMRIDRPGEPEGVPRKAFLNAGDGGVDRFVPFDGDQVDRRRSRLRSRTVRSDPAAVWRRFRSRSPCSGRLWC